MIFRVCEHYSEELIYKENCDKECFICFETKSSQGFKTINLTEQTIYLHNCRCNGPIHNECLQLWFNMNESCPICRNKMIERNNATIVVFYYLPYGISFYFFIKNVTLKILHIMLIFLFLHRLIELCFIIKTRYKLYDDYISISFSEDEYLDDF
jgi:hypothetical protein